LTVTTIATALFWRPRVEVLACKIFRRFHRSVYVYNNYRKRIAGVVRMGILYGARLGARHMDHGIPAGHDMARPAAEAVPVVARSWRGYDFPDE
jgi:hypothetical protein